jgi:hypothetical protein
MLPAGEESLVRGDRVVGRWLVRVVVEELGERRRRRARRDKDGEGFVIDVVCDLSVSRQLLEQTLPKYLQWDRKKWRCPAYALCGRCFLGAPRGLSGGG